VNDWGVQETKLLHRCWPSLIQADGTNWCKIPDFVLPTGWNRQTATVAFQIPDALPGQEPYAFWVEGGLALASGATVSNYAYPAESTPWDGHWGKFSWSLDPWRPGARPGEGTSMVDFVRSFSARLRELN
jgi:Prokaryotic E2 family E